MLRSQLCVLAVHEHLSGKNWFASAADAMVDIAFEFTHVTCFEKALAHAATHPVDAIVLDFSDMGDEGQAATFAIRRKLPQMPILILTDRLNLRNALQAAHYGVQDILVHDEMQPELLAWKLGHAINQHAVAQLLESHIGELELTNGRFLSLVADNADAILVVDKTGTIRFVNPSAERLLRCNVNDLLGQMFGIPLEGVDLTEIDLTNRPGGLRTAEIRVTDTLWDGDKANIVTMRDVTERKRIELALKVAKQTAEQASAMKSQFLASMSHELRTPLNAIIGYSEMMMLGIGGSIGQPFKGYARDIHDGGKHLLSLINDLLDMSKAESGKLELTEENFDLVNLCHEVSELMEVNCRANQIELNVGADRGSLWVRGDKRMFKQIVMNLTSNALKFSHEGATVSIVVNLSPGGEAKVTVIDNGIGIPRDQIPRAFAAFVQIDNSFSRKVNQGTGLGLALTKRFVELHDGRIQLDSEEGRGTTVQITLPHGRVVSASAEPFDGNVASLGYEVPALRDAAAG